MTDKQMETSIGRMLRVGVTLSAAVVLLGGLLYLKHPASTAPDYTHFAAQNASLRSLRDLLVGAAHLDAQSVIQIGILLLIATPITRVAFCVMGFARQRDKLYVAISVSVLLILIYSLFQGWR